MPEETSGALLPVPWRLRAACSPLAVCPANHVFGKIGLDSGSRVPI
jgi:hypothetical protein